MRRTILSAFAALSLLVAPVVSTPVQAAEKTYQTLLGTAIDGTDPVAYFTEGRPVEGSRQFTHDWNGARWWFASAQNRDTFAADPAKYAPQYGGYCAYAVSQGYTAKTDPDAWSIADGKLYLNYSLKVRDLWSQDIPGHIASANGNWPGVLN